MFSLPGLLIFVIYFSYLHGIFIGFFTSIFGITLGCLLFFIFARYIFKSFFINFFIKYTNNIDKYISKSTTEYLIIFRMIPGNPLIIQNFLLSLIKISISKYIFITVIGLSPIIFFSTYLGNKFKNIKSIKNINTSEIFTLDFLLFIFLIILFLIIKILFKKKDPHN